MSLRPIGDVRLPAHKKPGGFDHATLHQGTGRMYVAHTANDALDVIDCAGGRYLGSVEGLPGVAGALVSEEERLVFTSNRAENTIGVFSVSDDANVGTIAVGVRPNGLAYCPARRLLLAANVGDPAVPGSFTASIVDVARRKVISDVPVPGRTRWAIYDAETDSFYVNIAAPAQIVCVRAADPTRVARALPIPSDGPHGLDLDPATRRLFCACDGGRLVVVDIDAWEIAEDARIGGVPDVVFLNSACQHLYVAIGDPGTVEVIDTRTLATVQIVSTEAGAHTTGFDPVRSQLYVFCPQTHRAVVYEDGDD